MSINGVQFKHSTEPGHTPTTSSLPDRQLAVNTADKRIFANLGGEIVEVALMTDLPPVNKAYLTLMYAADLQNPNTANWAVNGSAPVAADSVSPTLDVRTLNDTTEVGVGFMAAIPAGALNLNLTLKGRAEVLPTTGNNTVVFKLYAKQIPSDAAVGAWNAGTVLQTITLPLQTYFHSAQLSQALSSLGLVADTTYQFELTRVGANTNDKLSGNFDLLEILLELV